MLEQLGMKGGQPVVTPGVKTSALPEEDDPLLDPMAATTFRRLIARANFIAQDRMDIQYAVKEAARGMANPRQSHHDKLVRIGKYLLGRPRYVIKFAAQKDVFSINCYGDSDFAGEQETRKSTSGGILCLGDHSIKS